MSIRRILTSGRRPANADKRPTREPAEPAVNVARVERAKAAGTPPPYTPPAGFPADPREFLAYLQAGQFTVEQIAYLRSNALTQYVSAINSARGMPGLGDAVALGDQIIAAWIAALAALGPAPAGNPFGIA